jgi:hypothetical protein
MTKAPDFAPDDPTDGREPLDWRSKYELDARKIIRKETIYLGLLLAAIPFGLLFLWLSFPKNPFGIDEKKYATIVKYGIAWLCGTLGGTLFAIKWLYHSVARQIWHQDRGLWRLFTPHLSGGSAFAVIVLVSSGMFRIFDRQAINSLCLIGGMSFLVGYFSDSAMAKLKEIADTLFGAIRKDTDHKNKSIT